MNELVDLSCFASAGERQFDDRIVGRVFDVNGRLHWVVKVYSSTGLAQVRERLLVREVVRHEDAGQEAKPPVREYLMPVSEVRLWLIRNQRKR